MQDHAGSHAEGAIGLACGVVLLAALLAVLAWRRGHFATMRAAFPSAQPVHADDVSSLRHDAPSSSVPVYTSSSAPHFDSRSGGTGSSASRRTIASRNPRVFWNRSYGQDHSHGPDDTQDTYGLPTHTDAGCTVTVDAGGHTSPARGPGSLSNRAAAGSSAPQQISSSAVSHARSGVASNTQSGAEQSSEPTGSREGGSSSVATGGLVGASMSTIMDAQVAAPFHLAHTSQVRCASFSYESGNRFVLALHVCSPTSCRLAPQTHEPANLRVSGPAQHTSASAATISSSAESKHR